MNMTLLGGRYEIIEKIGEGGMAEVYKAKCHFLNRYVAVKMLKKEFVENKEFVEKFQTEARAAASLSNSHIVTIYDIGNENDIYYIVMEYINGKTLKRIIKEQKKLDYKQAINISIQIAQALNNAHSNNIIHRDIKPHNIMITKEGIVKVTDFGIARVSNFNTITNTKKVIGSAHYFSPEQAKGSYVDKRSDIYSLGIIMYEMITGKLPFDGDTPVAVALKHLNGKIIPPIEICPEIPQSLNDLILKCTERDPINRYQDTKDLIKDLESIKHDKNVNIDINSYDDDYTKVMNPVGENKSSNGIIETMNNDNDDRNTKKTSIFKKIGIAFLTIIVIISAVGIVLKYHFDKTVVNGETVVPNIVGLNKKEAEKLLKDSNLKYIFQDTYTSDNVKGQVISCNPDEGMVVKKNSVVTVVVSKGEAQVTVPNLINLNILVAKDEIINNKLTVGNITEEYSDTVPKDNVITQSPMYNTKCDVGEKINLVVSKGPENTMVKVPDLTGKSLEEAKKILEELDLKLGKSVSLTTNDKKKDGTIFDQSIILREVEKGTEIDVSYFKYDSELP